MLLSIFQVTEKVGLGLDWQTTRDWIEGGVMPSPIIVGGFLRWPQSQLDVWVEQGCPQSAALSERDCDPLWDALLAELKALDETRKENVR